MNRHLNVFRPYSLDQSKEHIEDNLSRALVLCLKHDTLLFHEFLQTIMLNSHIDGKSDYNYLFTNLSEKDTVNIDIQIDVTILNENSYRRIYAIAVTSEVLEMTNFNNYLYSATKDYRPITDILITINDIAFVFEVKRWGEDCRQQLYNQVYQLTAKSNPTTSIKNQSIDAIDNVIPFSFDWKQIMTLIVTTNNFNTLHSKPNLFISDFIHLVQSYNINWLPITPFASIPHTVDMDGKRHQRLAAAINNLPDELTALDSNARMGLEVDFGWAKEILPWFERDAKNNLSLNFYIWPGNTKGQGWKTFYSNKLDRLHDHKSVIINNKEFNLIIENEIKFSHFNRYVCELDFNDENLLKEIVTTRNFEKYAGKHNREDWNELEVFFDDYFKPEYNWREHCDWDENFINTNRGYLTLSIGYQIKTVIPYDYLQSVDSSESDLKNLTDIFIQVYNFYKNLL